MYKLFLTIRYLTRKKIVLFPILAVWLCVMMMIIVTSIMGGFVDRAQQVNHDLYGDLVISSPSLSGWPFYDELGDAIQKRFPEVTDWTPIVHGYGLINLPDRPGATAGVQVVGVDPVGRSKVSKFRETLFHQYESPIRAADDLAAMGLPKTGLELQKESEARNQAIGDEAWKIQSNAWEAEASGKTPSPKPWWWALVGMAPVLALALWTLGRKYRRTVWSVVASLGIFVIGSGVVTLILFWPILFPSGISLLEDAREQAIIRADRAYRTARLAADLDPDKTFTSKEQLLDILLPKAPSFAVPAEAYARQGGAENAWKDGCFVGVELGLFRRDRRGNFRRSPESDYIKAILTVVPISTAGSIQTGHASQHRFTIVDDSYTGVIDVDKQNVYAAFDIVQEMAGMRPDVPKGDERYFEPRCNEILMRLKPGTTPDGMRQTRDKMAAFVDAFVGEHPGMRVLDVQTWEEQQKSYLDAVKNEKVMITFILLLMSGVVLVVIFLIFYMIVRDKTRDIGIIKAVGGSEEGVAAIFLTYGLFIGFVGGAVGVISGVAFVRHTNEIHELIFRATGITIWDRKVYLFDRIPDTVHPWEVATYFAMALIAGVLGALIPAIVAGSEDPVKAVRYE